MTNDPRKLRAVVVNNGSGVVMPAMTKQYCYILTAVHNLQSDPDDRSTLLSLSEIKITFLDGRTIFPQAIFSSSTEDAAILLITGIENVEPVAYSNDSPIYQNTITILGYPETRRCSGKNPEIKLIRGLVEDIEQHRLDVSTSTFSSKEEIMGMSGGGVYCQIEEEWLLVGIEYSMEGPESESQNWLSCARVRVFEQIIIDNSFEDCSLAPILPPYLRDFQNLVEQTFPLDGFECDCTKSLIRKLLWDIAKGKLVDDCPTPHSIMEKYGEQLLVSGDPLHRLADKKLWLSWIEFFVMSILLDKPKDINGEYIENVRKKRRLLYSGSPKEWTSFLTEIYGSNFSGMDHDGLVLISTNRPPIKTRSSFNLAKLVPDISRPQGAKRDITSSCKPTLPLKLMHIDGLNKDCLVLNEVQYPHGEDFNPNIVLTRLTEAYRAAIA